MPNDDLFVKSSDELTRIVLDNAFEDLVLQLLRDDLLGWYVFKSEIESAVEPVEFVELLGDVDIRLTFIVEFHDYY